MNTTLAIFGLGTTELIVILALGLLLFGGSRLPSLAKGMNQALRYLRGGFADKPLTVDEEENENTKQ